MKSVIYTVISITVVFYLLMCYIYNSFSAAKIPIEDKQIAVIGYVVVLIVGISITQMIKETNDRK